MSGKKIEASLSISRDSRDVIRIRIRDEAAVLTFAELELSPHDFAMALTGLSEIKCKTAVRNLEKVGTKRIREPRVATCPIQTYDKAALTQWLKENCQEIGWEIDTYLGSQSSIRHIKDGVVLNYAVTKYVELEQ